MPHEVCVKTRPPALNGRPLHFSCPTPLTTANRLLARLKSAPRPMLIHFLGEARAVFGLGGGAGTGGGSGGSGSGSGASGTPTPAAAPPPVAAAAAVPTPVPLPAQGPATPLGDLDEGSAGLF